MDLKKNMFHILVPNFKLPRSIFQMQVVYSRGYHVLSGAYSRIFQIDPLPPLTPEIEMSAPDPPSRPPWSRLIQIHELNLSVHFRVHSCPFLTHAFENQFNFHTGKMLNLTKPMVLMSDGNSEMDAHVGRDLGYLICLRH